MLEELLNKTREKRAVSLAEAETIVTKATRRWLLLMRPTSRSNAWSS
jgi:hypothetical protein